jgi:alkylation response protein AidB-like acyl-CoA dehydrogenase
VTYLPTADHDELRAMVRELADERIAPRAAEIDEKQEFPWDLKELLAQQDLLGTCFEERHGGTGLDTIAQSIVVEEIARADATTSLIPIVQKLGALPILLAGSDDQKDRYFPRLASGEWLIAFALTEAAAGSDVAANRMRATRAGDHYVLNGSKRFITHGSVANLLTVFALTDPDAGGRKGMSAFIVETATPGFNAPRVEHKMGIRGSPTAELTFDGVQVPLDNRLGAEGDGFKIAMATLDRSRLGIAAQAVGIAQGALDAAVAYAADRNAVRPARRRLPGDPVDAGRHGLPDRGRPPADLRRRGAGRRGGIGPAVLDQQRQARGGGRGDEGHHRCRPGAGRIRLYRRVPRGAHDARCEDHAALRGDATDPTPHRGAPAPPAGRRVDEGLNQSQGAEHADREDRRLYQAGPGHRRRQALHR